MSQRVRVDYPENNSMQTTPLYTMIGLIEEVDTVNNLATVNTPHGRFTNARIPMPYYSSTGTGIFITPSPGDVVTIALTSEYEPFILSYYSLNPSIEKEAGSREAPKPHSFIMKTKAGDKLVMSTDFKTTGISALSPTAIDLTVNNGTIILKGETADEDKTETTSLKIDTASAIHTFTVKDGDGTALVTQKLLQDVVDKIMNYLSTLTLPISGATAGPPIPPLPTITAVGVTGLQTIKAEAAGPVASKNIPAAVEDNPAVASASTTVDTANAAVTTKQQAVDIAKAAVEPAKQVVADSETAFTAAKTTYDTAGTAYAAAGGTPTPTPYLTPAQLLTETAFRATPVGISAYAVILPLETAYIVTKKIYDEAQVALAAILSALDVVQKKLDEAIKAALAAGKALEDAVAAAMATLPTLPNV